MTLESAPDGTVVVIGHPGNGHTATKRAGRWHSSADNRVLDLDPRDVSNVLFTPTH